MLKYLERDGINDGFNASHAYCVALDSVYGAYLKANYPLEYYSVVLNIYQSNTIQTAKITKELDYFGIEIQPIKYGKSKGEYSPDKKTNSIYKGIGSIKFMNSSVANELYEMSQENNYETFLNLLIDIVERTKLNKRHITTLIKLDFFSDFGDKSHLLSIYEEFSEGRNKYSKVHIDKTKAKRIEMLKEIQSEILESTPEKQDLIEQIVFEKDVLGYSITKYPSLDESVFLVLEVNEKFTPRSTMYRLKDGKEIQFKTSKDQYYDVYSDTVMYKKGDVIQALSQSEKHGWKKENGKWVKNEDRTELWLDECKVIRRSK